MNRAICSHCASYCHILRALHADGKRTTADWCAFCMRPDETLRAIPYPAKTRKITTMAIEVLPFGKKGVGLKAIAHLAALESNQRSRTNSTGVLITTGLATMAADGLPEITAAGRDYLRKLRLERFRL